METLENETTETENSSKKEESLTERFQRERIEWKDKIADMSERLRDIYKLADLLTDIYTSRQIALEYSHTIMVHLSRLNSVFRKKKIEKFDYYSREYEMRLDKETKMDYIMVDLRVLVEKRELLQNHLDYLRETIKTIDNLTFGVKHRMSLEEYRRG